MAAKDGAVYHDNMNLITYRGVMGVNEHEWGVVRLLQHYYDKSEIS